MPSIAQLEKLLDPASPDPFILYGLAQEYAKLGDHARAVEFFDRCLAADAAYCYAYYHKARVLLAANRRPEAAETIRRGIAAAKTHDPHALGELTDLLESLE